MKSLLKILSLVLIGTLLFSCKTKKDIKDISVFMPDRKEVKLDLVKEIRFIRDTNQKTMPIKFGDFDLPDKTIVYFSRLDSARIYEPLVRFNDTTTLIPCNAFSDFYEDVPLVVPYNICIYRPDVPDPLPIGIKSSPGNPFETDIHEVKYRDNIRRLQCFSGWVIVNAEVTCLVCPHQYHTCAARYTLFGQQYVSAVLIPPQEYFVRRGSSSSPCGNCPN